MAETVMILFIVLVHIMKVYLMKRLQNHIKAAQHTLEINYTVKQEMMKSMQTDLAI